MKLYIVGAGPGDASYLTAAARGAITDAELVIATPRLFEQLGHLNTNTVCKSIGEFSASVRAAQNVHAKVAVLVSGDSGFFSVSKKLVADMEGVQGLELHCLSGISSLQYLCARLCLPYDSLKIVSVHGRSGSVIPAVCYNPLVFALTGGEKKAHTIIEELIAAGLEHVNLAVGENLSTPEERMLHGTAHSLRHERFSDLTSLIIRNEHWVNPHSHVPDQAFLRGQVPMTKWAVRAQALATLSVQPTDTVLDIGAGTGAMTVELARKAHEGMVYALEKAPSAVELIRQNRAQFRAFNINIIQANAPDGLNSLPPVDKVFIGGSGGKLAEIIARLTSANPLVELAVTAISLETLHQAVASLAAHGYEPEIVCLNAAVAHKAGKYHMMQAENPVYIISGKKSAH